MVIECLVLGAGQEVGKSCVVVSIGGKSIMCDCGMHIGYLDERRYPDFSLISESGDFDNALTCIIITHLYETSLYLIQTNKQTNTCTQTSTVFNSISTLFNLFNSTFSVIWIMWETSLTSLRSVDIGARFT
uniref:Uncharacterized protein n=1 Tax=Nelumbo nucifera TaxID=4432 RepID=A0A822YIC3_NELNU|nr:TPA_asm: hypothetical protein HUJ06_011083 [Nelumbo nucifera]